MFKYTLLFFLISCTQIVKTLEDDYYEVIDNKSNSEYLNLVFSHNINGEVHPCGCRNFPLGGMPQVAGELFSLREKTPVLYVDSGDALFPSTRIPDFLKESQIFTAKKIAESFDMNKLDFFLPGDQDFANGEDFLAEISLKHKFQFIISNIKKTTKIKHKKWAAKKFGEKTLVFLGVLDPSLLQQEHRSLFYSPQIAIAESIKEIKDQFGSLNNISLVLLSHSGMDTDKIYANEFKDIDWIIGSHSQAFTQMTVDVNKTKIVQVLSRNHFLGQIQVQASLKKEDTFKVIEIRDELQNKWKENPMISWLGNYKVEIDKIQLEEQKKMSGNDHSEIKKAQTFQSCMECHQEQGQFWQKTSHSLAFITLDNAKSSNNPTCIGCHSLNYKSLKGFQNTDEIIDSKKDLKTYWSEWEKEFKNIKSIRKLTDKKRFAYSKKWIALDKKFEVKHNFANVQCLHCHEKASDHPFEMTETVPKTKDFKAKCVNCHTKDQSPEWYDKDSKGIATSLNSAYVAKMIKKIACPVRKD